MQSLKAHFLVASPHLEDPNFVRSVVLLFEHTNNGAWGVVVNRPINKTISELWKEVGAEPCESVHPVHLGGPVPGPLHSLHTIALLGEEEILPGLFLSRERPNLDKLVARPDEPLKIFLGHSGWGPGQLERELREGAWFTAPADRDAALTLEINLWQRICKRIGEDVLQSSLNLRNMPTDPTVN
ncbi:MAG: YqgE/AlgH family protein [Planctomycetota bacterium]